jgi:hypothetical protein
MNAEEHAGNASVIDEVGTVSAIQLTGGARDESIAWSWGLTFDLQAKEH